MPVIEIEDANDAVPLAEALLRGGIKVAEITLRTSAALQAVKALANTNEIRVGAGTLLNAEQVKSAKDAGAEFGVSPGATATLIEACEKANLPFLPGAATPSEVINLEQQGFGIQKFFPAEAAGGVEMLKAISGPLPNVRFCPTGGISYDNTRSYLSQVNVICVGGSWIAPRKLIAGKKWSEIEANAKLASSLKPI